MIVLHLIDNIHIGILLHIRFNGLICAICRTIIDYDNLFDQVIFCLIFNRIQHPAEWGAAEARSGADL